jgi:uncharacterized Zn finger protein (UPF0148 family)
MNTRTNTLCSVCGTADYMEEGDAACLACRTDTAMTTPQPEAKQEALSPTTRAQYQATEMRLRDEVQKLQAEKREMAAALDMRTRERDAVIRDNDKLYAVNEQLQTARDECERQYQAKVEEVIGLLNERDTLQAEKLELVAALEGLLKYAELSECPHDDLSRGGTIWTLCNRCGAKWADDEGGFKTSAEPKQITEARAALAKGSK